MRSFLNTVLIFLLVSAIASAQSGTSKPTLAKPGEKVPVVASSATPSTTADGLPSEATIDSFLQQQFGYEKDLTWKISSIRPSAVAGLAEVTVVLASQQGQQSWRFFVAPDGEHALAGEIIPFGARPFDPVKKI